MASFYWWSIGWSRKSGTEDLDSVAYNWWNPGKFIALHVKAWKTNWELLCTSHVNQRNMKGYKYLKQRTSIFLTNSLAVLHNWNWRYNLKIKIKKKEEEANWCNHSMKSVHLLAFGHLLHFNCSCLEYIIVFCSMLVTC